MCCLHHVREFLSFIVSQDMKSKSLILVYLYPVILGHFYLVTVVLSMEFEPVRSNSAAHISSPL